MENADFLLDIYLEETWKNIDKLDDFIESKGVQEVITIEKEELNALLRTMHSIKGSSAMMGLPPISETAHRAEDLLSFLREEEDLKQEDVETSFQLLRMVSGYLKRELRRMETEDEVTDFGWAVVRRIQNFLAHVDNENEPEGPSYQIAYTRKGKQRIPYTDFTSLIPQMQRVAEMMGRELGKEYSVRVSGAGVEVPRDIFDKISMAVLQMMRNSMDHGLEHTDEREALGKTPIGEISLEIRKTAERVYVSFRDDGKGLDRDAILALAKRKRLLVKDADAYEDGEIYAFLLRAGFTTRSNATMFSGRGVGLDVVHAAISSLGGTVQIESRKYMGTTFFIEFPILV